MVDFVYGDWPRGSSAFVAEIPQGISSKEDIFAAYNAIFQFPFFGFNWDAFDEVMTDLEWISQQSIILRHSDLPKLSPRDLKIYLSILKALGEEQHDVPSATCKTYIVVFPKKDQAAIESRLSGLK